MLWRELRVQAGRARTYWLRGAGGLLIALMLLARWGAAAGLGAGGGGELFGQLHLLLFAATWIVVPLLSADTLSRERREGTLGLLFLTHLRPMDIVVAKVLTEGLRALSLWLSMLPLLAVCLLMGGVSGKEIMMSWCVNFSAMCLALGAGVLASSVSRYRGTAAGWALLLAGAFAAVNFLALGGSGMIVVDWFRKLPFFSTPLAVGWTGCWDIGFGLQTGVQTNWARLLRQLSRLGAGGFVVIYPIQAIFSAGVLFVVMWLAAVRLRRNWQEGPPPRWQRRGNELASRPVFGPALARRWRAALLSAHPLVWLEWRNWVSRLVAWGWMGLAAGLLTWEIASEIRPFEWFGEMDVVAGLLLMAVAGVAAASFRRERESGALELLLVTPGGEDRLLRGRCLGIAGQFLPALLLVLVVSRWLPPSMAGPDPLLFWGLLGVGLATLMVVGLYFSLRRVPFLVAWGLTLGLGLIALVPWLMTARSRPLSRLYFAGPMADDYALGPSLPFALTLLCELTIAGLFWGGLRRALRAREFLGKSTGKSY